jgi:FeoB-associated Cys-rich membrane protein
MIWQPFVVIGIVLAATAYLVWQSWRTWFGAKSGCGGGCHCAGKKNDAAANATGSPATLISVDELTQRLRSKS